MLFILVGVVYDRAHTREIDHLGGLAVGMPRTAFCFLVGAVAICGLPPLNGFVSEFLIYLGLFGTITKAPSIAGAAMAAPALALIGALATAVTASHWASAGPEEHFGFDPTAEGTISKGRLQ